jgi:hypothetical protein
MRWLIGLCAVVLLGALICGLAKSEELTTTNLVPGMSGFTATGGTSVGTGAGCSSGAYCTSGTNEGGGSYTSSFDVPLTEAEVKLGFTLNSAITINSHISNSRLATCSSVSQSGDCRDIFKLTISLLDSGTQVQSFTHQEELNWTGLRDFTFTDTVAANSYGVLTGMLELYGIDAGYPVGFYGPQFSDPSLTIDYQTALVQQQVEQEIQQLIEQTAVVQVVELLPPPAPVAETTAAPPPVTDIAPPAAMDIAPPTMTTTIAPPAAPTIAPISPPQTETQQTQEAQAEAQIEAVVEAQPEAQPEATAEAEPEAQPEPEAAEAQPQQAAAPAPTKTAPKAAAKATPKAKARARMTPAVAAQTVVDNIAPSQRYGSAAQTTTLVAMGMIGGNRTLFKGAGIADAPTFFKSTTIPDGPSIVDTMTNYRFGGQASAAHNALVESQWSK